MKSFFAVFAAVLTCTLIYAQTAIPTFPKLKDTDPLPAGLFINLAKVVNPAVVNIYTTYGMPDSRMYGGGDPYRDPFFDLFEQFMGPGRGQPQQSLGTGFIIREDGLIVTNNHVVDRADIIKVQLEEGAKQDFEARLIGKDSRSDIALIKIDAKRKLPFLKMGSSSEVQVGEWVAAFGNPYGYGHTMTKGIISAVNREIDELNLFPFMQTDASINPGNSGGPLVNTQGLVIGVNAAIDARAQGIGFVIPIDNVKSILPELEKSGSIQRGFIGVQMTDIDPERAEASGLKNTEGALIMQVVPGKAAEKAGVQPWDLIVEFDGKKVTSTRDLSKLAATTPVGKKVPMKVIRNGKEKSLTLTMGSSLEPSDRPAKVAGKSGSKGFQGLQKAPYGVGFAVVDYTAQLADEYGLPNLRQPHPVIISVQPNSESARAGLAPGDIIMDVNRREVSKAKDVVRNLKRGTINILRVLKRDRMVLISIRAN
jgi:serine protease Do